MNAPKPIRGTAIRLVVAASAVCAAWSGVAATGLDQFVYRGPVQPPWPTLREMITNDQRILVCTENNSEGVPWIHPAFGVYQETPYKFLNPTEFSCAVGRGGTQAPLFQINHWIQTAPAPRPSNAEIVNDATRDRDEPDAP